ncbi:MAG TPA: prepilin peptidase [Aeromicrobium sp.]|nr:prepilin peptidase [Aeromicrobium sp.]
MTTALIAAMAALVAGLLGAFSPKLLAHLPEPAGEPEPDMPPKIAYAELAKAPGLWWKMAVPAAALGAVAGALLEHWELLGVWILLAAATPVLAWVDWKVHLLPFLIVAPLYLLSWLFTGVGALVLRDPSVLLHALWGNLAIFGFYFLAGLVGPMGYGDVRLSAVLGVALGPLGFITAFYGVFFGLIIGAVAGVVLVRGQLGKKIPIAFGPYLLLGAFAALLL